jgi:hypothetical protein
LSGRFYTPTNRDKLSDQIMLVQVTRAHQDEAFVRQALADVPAQRPVPLVHKGCGTTSVLLRGGTCLVLFLARLLCGYTGNRDTL